MTFFLLARQGYRQNPALEVSKRRGSLQSGVKFGRRLTQTHYEALRERL